MLIISHRGYKLKYKENTLESINYAFNIPYVDGVEFDVRITKDKKFVLLHDFFIDRVSDGHGAVNKKSYRKLKKYNFGTKNNILKIPLLKDVLKIETNKIFMIEIKFNYKEYLKVKKRFIKLLNKYKDKNIYICTFNESIINDLIKYNLSFKLGLISRENINNKDLDFYSINYLFFNEKILKQIKNKELFLWTINNKSDINKIKEKDNLGLITDYPKLFKKYHENN